MQQPIELVKLNIGGVRYMTTARTLKGENQRQEFAAMSPLPPPRIARHSIEPNFFTGLLSDAFQPCVDDQGFIFIDRNGLYFGPILDYLRTGVWNVPSNMSESAVLREAAFYSIEPDRTAYLSDKGLHSIMKQHNAVRYLELWEAQEERLTDIKDLIISSFKRTASSFFSHTQDTSAISPSLSPSSITTPILFPSRDAICQCLERLRTNYERSVFPGYLQYIEANLSAFATDRSPDCLFLSQQQVDEAAPWTAQLFNRNMSGAGSEKQPAEGQDYETRLSRESCDLLVWYLRTHHDLSVSYRMVPLCTSRFEGHFWIDQQANTQQQDAEKHTQAMYKTLKDAFVYAEDMRGLKAITGVQFYWLGKKGLHQATPTSSSLSSNNNQAPTKDSSQNNVSSPSVLTAGMAGFEHAATW